MQKREFLLAAPACVVAALLVSGCSQRNERRSIFQIESSLVDAEARLAALRASLDVFSESAITLRTVRTNVNVAGDIDLAIKQNFTDDAGAIFLAGSGFIADVAIKYFKNTPILFATQSDPVETNLVMSLVEPQVNRTGFTYHAGSLMPVVNLMTQIQPKIAGVGILGDSLMQREITSKTNKFNRLNSKIELIPMYADTNDELEACFTLSDKKKLDAWIIRETDIVQKKHIAINERLAKSGVIAAYQHHRFVEAGGLLGYSPTISDPYAIWIRQIRLLLAGVPAAKIPVESPREFKLFLNLDTAKDLGLDLPKGLLKTATRVFYRG